FEDCSDNNSNEANAVNSIVPIVGQNSLNNTNTFSAAGPSNADNNDKDAAFDGKEHDFDKTKKEAKGKSHVEFVTGYRDLNAEFEDCFDNSSNEVNAAGSIVPTVGQNSLNNTNTFSAAELEDITYSDDENTVGAEADFNNLETSIIVSPILTTRIHKDHPVSQIIGNLSSTTQTRSMTRVVKDQVARIEAIRLFLAYASFMGFMVYQMDVKSAFLYETIVEEVYVCQPTGFEDPDHPDKVYKVVKALYGLHQAPKACTPIDTEKPLLKDLDGEDVDVHTYRVGRVFSGVKTPLFEGMLVEQVVEEGGDAEEHVDDDIAAQGDDTTTQGNDLEKGNKRKTLAIHIIIGRIFMSPAPSIPSPTPPTPPPQPPQDLPSTSQVRHTPPQSPLPQPQPQAQQQAADFPLSLLQEVFDTCAALTRRVEHLKCDKVAQALEITKLKRRVKKLEKGNRVKVSKLRRLKRVGTSKSVDTSEDTIMDDASNQGRIIDDLDKDDVVFLIDDKEEDKNEEEAQVVEDDQLITEVVTAASETVTAVSAIISAAEPQVPAATITVAPVRVVVASTRRRKEMVIRDLEEESTTSLIIPADTKSKDKGKGIMVEEPKPLKKKQHVEMDEEYVRKLHAELNKDIDWDVSIDHVKQKAKEDPAVQRYQVMKKKGCPMMTYVQSEVKFNLNIEFLLKTKEHMEEEESRALQSINETPAKKTAKKRKLNEEVEDLKRHLEIVPNEDDDVYTEATPLARKVHVVDYEIINLNNKPFYKIIRADGTHQLYISFLTLLKNFDREDLEALWNLVKERFSTSKPKNFSDDFLLNTLGAMFEKPDGQAQLWKN
nr:putative ribonuclease H-like domain-containing protein [Tanacetum cinerariifolium]